MEDAGGKDARKQCYKLHSKKKRKRHVVPVMSGDHI